MQEKTQNQLNGEGHTLLLYNTYQPEEKWRKLDERIVYAMRAHACVCVVCIVRMCGVYYLVTFCQFLTN
jgi:hypothetical protein